MTVFGRKEAKPVMADIANRLKTFEEPPKPVEGPILTALKHERLTCLGEMQKLNWKITELEAKVAWFERNPQAEVYFPQVAEILDSLRKKEDGTIRTS
jgi:hypothetical protein